MISVCASRTFFFAFPCPFNEIMVNNHYCHVFHIFPFVTTKIEIFPDGLIDLFGDSSRNPLNSNSIVLSRYKKNHRSKRYRTYLKILNEFFQQYLYELSDLALTTISLKFHWSLNVTIGDFLKRSPVLLSVYRIERLLTNNILYSSPRSSLYFVIWVLYEWLLEWM